MIPRVRTSVVVIHNDKILTFRAVDPLNGAEYFFLPGGKIEATESAPEAAARETLEETGFKVLVIPESCLDKEYTFDWNGETYDCLTLFYRGILQNTLQAVVNDAAYNKGVHWHHISEIKKIFSYSSATLAAIEALI